MFDFTRDIWSDSWTPYARTIVVPQTTRVSSSAWSQASHVGNHGVTLFGSTGKQWLDLFSALLVPAVFW